MINIDEEIFTKFTNLQSLEEVKKFDFKTFRPENFYKYFYASKKLFMLSESIIGVIISNQKRIFHEIMSKIEDENIMYVYNTVKNSVMKAYIKNNNDNKNDFSFFSITNILSSNDKIFINNNNNKSSSNLYLQNSFNTHTNCNTNINNDKLSEPLIEETPSFYISFHVGSNFYLWYFSNQINDKIFVKIPIIINNSTPQKYLLSLEKTHNFLGEKNYCQKIYKQRKPVCKKLNLLLDSISSKFTLVALVEDLIYIYKFHFIKEFNNKNNNAIEVEYQIFSENYVEIIPLITNNNENLLPVISLIDDNALLSTNTNFDSNSKIYDFTNVKLKDLFLGDFIADCQIITISEQVKNDNYVGFVLSLANLAFTPKGTKYQIVQSVRLIGETLCFTVVDNKFIAVFSKCLDNNLLGYYCFELYNLSNLTLVGKLNLLDNKAGFSLSSEYLKLHLLKNNYILIKKGKEYFLFTDIENFYEYFNCFNEKSTNKLSMLDNKKPYLLTYKAESGREPMSDLFKIEENTIYISDKKGYFLISRLYYNYEEAENFLAMIINY